MPTGTNKRNRAAATALLQLCRVGDIDGDAGRAIGRDGNSLRVRRIGIAGDRLAGDGAALSQPAQATLALNSMTDGTARACSTETVRRRGRKARGTARDIQHSWTRDQELRICGTAQAVCRVVNGFDR